MTTAKTKAAADQDCKTANARSSLLTPKSQFVQTKLEQYLSLNPLTPDSNADFFLGITHNNEQWQWDDTKESVFIQSKYKRCFMH